MYVNGILNSPHHPIGWENTPYLQTKTPNRPANNRKHNHRTQYRGTQSYVLETNLLYFLSFYYRTRLHRRIHTEILSSTHSRSNRLPMRRASSNDRACYHALPFIYSRAPQTPSVQRPRKKLPTAPRNPKVHTRAASVPTGDESLQ